MKNKYYILRHGEALLNKKLVFCCWPEKFHCPLTRKGRKEVRAAAEKLRNKKIDLIFASDLLRTRQTAEIVGKILGIKPKYNKKLREVNCGIFNGKPVGDLKKFFSSFEERFIKKPPKGETYRELQKRMYDFLRSIDKKYSGKTILIISHQAPLGLLEAKIKRIPDKEYFKKYSKERKIKTGELRRLK